jgi:hypothetical protein
MSASMSIVAWVLVGERRSELLLGSKPTTKTVQRTLSFLKTECDNFMETGGMIATLCNLVDICAFSSARSEAVHYVLNLSH